MDLKYDKSALRAHFIQKRRERNPDEYRMKSAQISERLYAFCNERGYEIVHTFLPMTEKGEPDITPFIDRSLGDGMMLMVPEVVRGQLQMRHHWYRLETQLQGSHWGILVPVVADLADPGLADAVVVPLLAVDSLGCRVGYGKGYYDYFLARMQADFIGVCFDDEIVDALPSEPHDVPMHVLVTDSRTIRVTNA